jgi:hypothetical protein
LCDVVRLHRPRAAPHAPCPLRPGAPSGSIGQRAAVSPPLSAPSGRSVGAPPSRVLLPSFCSSLLIAVVHVFENGQSTCSSPPPSSLVGRGGPHRPESLCGSSTGGWSLPDMMSD